MIQPAAAEAPAGRAAPAAARPPKLCLRAVAKRYDGVVALEPCDLEMAEGEFLTLLGPSGSGKTTLLSIVAGLIRPSGGDVWIDGGRATDLPPYRRAIGMVFQSYALFPHLSVFENIAFPLRMRRLPHDAIAREVGRVLAAVQLPEVAHRLPRELSGGQQQRIALARAIVYRPSIVLMDEPLGALDKNLRDQMQAEIKRLHTELGITILYVTHDQEEAFALSDRICLMNRARIEQVGTPAELYFRPASAFAAGFLGESNTLAGELAALDGRDAVLRLPGGQVLRAPRADGLAPGRRARWMVRPEALRLAPAEGGCANLVRGRVQAVLFAGSVSKVQLTLADGTALIAKVLTSAGALPRPGDDIAVGWQREDMVLLPEPAP